MRAEASAAHGRLNEPLEFLSFVGWSQHGIGPALKNVRDTTIDASQADDEGPGEAGTDDLLTNNPPAAVIQRQIVSWTELASNISNILVELRITPSPWHRSGASPEPLSQL